MILPAAAGTSTRRPRVGRPRRRFALDPQKALQVGFVVLLVVCAAQVLWWIYDEVQYTGGIQRSILEHHAKDAAAAAELTRLGMSRAQVAELFDHLEWEGEPWVFAEELSPALTELGMGRSETAELVRRLGFMADARLPRGELLDELERAGVEEGLLSELSEALAWHEGAWLLREEVLAELREVRRSRLSRYGWEGAFFLLVIVAGVAVLTRALRQDVLLRRRQQNFVAAVSHELKSPLASLRLATETLSLRDPPAEARARLVGRLLEDLDRLDALIGNLLDTARLEEGRLRLEPARVVVAEAATGVLADFEGRADKAGVALTLDAEGAEEAAIVADPLALRTVLRNLVDNALKAVEVDQGSRVALSVRREGERVTLAVEDDGVGFAPEEARLLFAKFYRPGDEMTRRSRGTGLGLYLVHRYVELDGGEVEAGSEGPGRGARFVLRWPAAGGKEA